VSINVSSSIKFKSKHPFKGYFVFLVNVIQAEKQMHAFNTKWNAFQNG